MVKKHQLCFGCLRKGHRQNVCKNKKECKKDGCKKLHHSLLHSEEKPCTENAATEVSVNTIKPAKSKIIFKVVPVEIIGPNRKIVRTFAFLDEGSSASLVNEQFAVNLGVQQQKDNLTLNWIENRTTVVSSMECNLRIRRQGRNSKWLRFSGNTVPNLQLPLQSLDLNELKDKYKRLRNVPIEGYTDANPMLLIGINNCHLTATLKSMILDNNLLVAKTSFGWSIYGSSGDCKERSLISTIFYVREQEENEMHKLIADYFTTENFGVNAAKEPLQSADDLRARSILKNTTKRLENSYETGLLWKNDDIHLPDSFDMAFSRLQGIEKRVMSMGKMNEYDAAIMDFVKKGYAAKLSKEETTKVGARTWYLPHFGVYNINKPKKIRLVFDGAATIDGVSLNTELLKGQDENPPLTQILFKFRQGIVAVCADRKCFCKCRFAKRIKIH